MGSRSWSRLVPLAALVPATALVILLGWNGIAEEAARRGSAVHGLSLNDAAAAARYEAEHGLRFPTLLLEDERARALLRAEVVPQTLVVEPDGSVVLARPGVLSPEAVDSIRALLPDRPDTHDDSRPKAPSRTPIQPGGIP